jgi:C1A family cysteine protease
MDKFVEFSEIMKLQVNFFVVFLITIADISAFIPLPESLNNIFTSNADADQKSDEHFTKLFKEFINTNKKAYKSPEEYKYRYEVFKDQLNKLIDKSKPLGDQISIESSSENSTRTKLLITTGNNPCIFSKNINSFADLTDAEFEKYYLLPEKFFDEEKYAPKSVLNFEDVTSESEELKLKLSEVDYNIFDDAIRNSNLKENNNKIQSNSSIGKPSYFDLLSDILSPKSSSFKNVASSETGVTQTCISYIYQSSASTSSKTTTPYGSLTKKSSHSTNISFQQKSFTSNSLFDTFPKPKRMLQSSRYGSYRSYRPSAYNFNYDDNQTYNPFPNNKKQNQSYRQNSFNYPSSNQDIFSNSYSKPNYEENLPQNAKNSQPKIIDGVELPSYLDWRDAGIISQIKDQYKCNACYAFSATAAIEANNALYNNESVILSEQEILDCSSENEGCVGGLPTLVFDYTKDIGISLQKDYPYKWLSEGDTCDRKSQTKKFDAVSGFIVIKKGVLSLIKALQFGPVATISYASNQFKYYSTGVYDGEGCDGAKKPNHSSLLVGYNLQAPKPYFIVKNSWGEDWGNNGYYYFAIGPLTNSNYGKCLFASSAFNSYPVIKKKYR